MATGKAAANPRSSPRNLLLCNGLFSSMCLQVLVLLVLSGIAASQNIVTKLPGYDGDLPFTLETGYVGVGDSNKSQLFYYFVESQRSPSEDPLMLWLTGGPGCSVLSAFFYESGPLAFTYADYNGSMPSFHLNPYTWTQGLNIIYVDAPVGTGFSYSTTQEGYYIDDLESASQLYQFLRKWLIQHPQYLENILYIGGDSYSGIPLPIIVQEIYDGNMNGTEPTLNLRGYVLGNPKTDSFIDDNSRIPFSHRLTLISDVLYKSAKESCNGDFVNVNDSNVACVSDIQAIDELLLQINTMQVLEPNCQVASPKSSKDYLSRRYIEENLDESLLSATSPAYWCRDYNYVLSAVWANNKSVREALNIRNGTTGVWKRCNSSLAYTKTVTSSVDYHRNLSNTNLRALIYSGDHDLSVTHIGTQNWIRYLNLTISEVWRAWYVDGQVAGYTEKFLNDDYNLIYATVKGAGHVAPEYKAKECYAMLDRWLAYYPL
ncbi:serine carboxypeptidase-like 13 [Juglans microcarpa x Juglans regia]|uniref:serine carboxypeptidase-like 13 n=1 Tax=Juglans microcarpa x Juglans regia TaxID=2249226 RepID=UPI001B7DFCE4|nr:serine carboxypeptidase-like 13 [Juglans microcarpa x Juglans regia]